MYASSCLHRLRMPPRRTAAFVRDEQASLDPHAFTESNYAMFHSIFSWCIFAVVNRYAAMSSCLPVVNRDAARSSSRLLSSCEEERRAEGTSFSFCLRVDPGNILGGTVETLDGPRKKTDLLYSALPVRTRTNIERPRRNKRTKAKYRIKTTTRTGDHAKALTQISLARLRR